MVCWTLFTLVAAFSRHIAFETGFIQNGCSCRAVVVFNLEDKGCVLTWLFSARHRLFKQRKTIFSPLRYFFIQCKTSLNHNRAELSHYEIIDQNDQCALFLRTCQFGTQHSALLSTKQNCFISGDSVYLYEALNGSSNFYTFIVRRTSSIPFTLTLCNDTIVYITLVTDDGLTGSYTALQVQYLHEMWKSKVQTALQLILISRTKVKT